MRMVQFGSLVLSPGQRDPVGLQTRSVIGERNNRWHNTNNTQSHNKRSYRSQGRMKIEVCKSSRITLGSSATKVLISMTHAWYNATDGNGATVRAVLFDFKRAFDLIDHRILVQKLSHFNIPEAVVLWISDFLSCCKHWASEARSRLWRDVPAGVP